MWPRFGIKVGNSTLCIAHVKSKDIGKIEIIANKQGDRISPACLLWDGNNEIECGLTAKQKMALRPKQAVANSFQLLLPPQLLSAEKIQETAMCEIPCDYDKKTGIFTLRCTSQADNDSKESMCQLSAYEVQTHIFRSELELARQYFSDTEHKPIVVISVPSCYPEEAWQLLAQAAEEAGFHVAQVITEPTAALLAYGIGESEVDSDGAETPLSHTKYVVCIKSGGLFSYFVLYAVRDGLYTELDVSEPFPIGGRHYTDTLVQFICDEFQRKHKLDPHESRRSVAKIHTAATNCKHILSTLPSTQLYIDSLMDGIDFNAQMSRARFESLIQPVIAEFMQTLNQWVEQIVQKNNEIKCIDSVVLLGATMQIPKLQAVIAARFPEAQVNASISAEEIAAVGSARQAAFLTEPQGTELQAFEDCVCAEEKLSIWHGEDEANAKIIVDKGSFLPTTVQLEIKLSENAENIDIFRLRSGGEVQEVCLKSTAPAVDNIIQIEANVDFEGNNMKPMVRLRCL